MKIDKSLIKQLSEYLEEFNLNEIEFTEKDTKIKVSKNSVTISNQNVPTTSNIKTDSNNQSVSSNTKNGIENK